MSDSGLSSGGGQQAAPARPRRGAHQLVGGGPASEDWASEAQSLWPESRDLEGVTVGDVGAVPDTTVRPGL